MDFLVCDDIIQDGAAHYSPPYSALLLYDTQQKDYSLFLVPYSSAKDVQPNSPIVWLSSTSCDL